MFNTARVLILILVFFLGFGAAAGGAIGGFLYVYNNVSINQMQSEFGLEINTDSFIGEYPEVYLRDMTLAGLATEVNELKSFGDTVTINFLVKRYALLLNSTMDQMLSNRAKNMPIRKLFSQEGFEVLFKSKYIGNIRGYEAVYVEGTKDTDDEIIDHWVYTDTKAEVRGLNGIIADYSIYDVLWGNLHADALFDSLTFGEVLEYEIRDDGFYYDKNGEKVTGILATVADCHMYDVQEKLTTVPIGDIIGYTYDETEEWWVDEDGNKVHTFTNTVASRNVNQLNSLTDELTLADIIPEEDRTTGYVSLLAPDTKLTNIASNVNEVFSETTMNEFVECGAITFENDPDGAKAEKFKNSSFGDKTMDEMIGFVVDNLDALEMISGE